ncbi:MAG: glycosyltransferase family 2 protein [Chloroflexia bacterium]
MPAYPGHVKIVVVFESITLPSQVQDKVARDNPQPDLSIIIVSWNVREHLLNCLGALFSPDVHGNLSLEVIVVDNASHDGSAQAATQFPVILRTNKENLGYGRANNAGLQISQGRHLMILNPDTLPHAGSLQPLVDFADARPEAGIISPRLLNPDGSVQAAAFSFPTLVMSILDLFPLPNFIPGRFRRKLLNSRINGRYHDEPTRTHPYRIEHPLGAAFLLRREAYEQCGGFDESIFMYSEEIDLALRYEDSGWECWQVPQSHIVHLGGQSTRQMPDTMFIELWRSRLHIYDHYYSLPSRLALRLILAIAMLRDMWSAQLITRRTRQTDYLASQMKRAKAVLRMALHR